MYPRCVLCNGWIPHKWTSFILKVEDTKDNFNKLTGSNNRSKLGLAGSLKAAGEPRLHPANNNKNNTTQKNQREKKIQQSHV